MKDIEYVTQRIAKMTRKELAKLAELADVSYGTVCGFRWLTKGKPPNPTMATLTSLAAVLKKNRAFDTTQPSAALMRLAKRRKERNIKLKSQD